MKSCLNIADLRAAARRRAHRMVFDYIDGGADDEWTLHNNSHAFNRYQLVHKVLAGVDAPDTRITLLGEQLPLPFFSSPTAGNRLFHTQGERAVASVANEFAVPYCLSTLSSVPMEEIARIKQGHKWFQLYVWKDRALVQEMLDRAWEAGFTVLILTADFAVTGNRERDPRNGFVIPPKLGLRQIRDALLSPAWTWDYLFSPPISYANISETTAAMSLVEFIDSQMHAGFNWKDAEWLLGQWRGASAIKGVLRPDDARIAADLGFKLAFVSNHGGRQLDGCVAPVDALGPILDTVGDRMELVLDGGVRRGTDILRALALGARAVSFGRPYLYGLAAGGRAGVHRAFTILAEELRRDMSLIGVHKLDELDASFIRHLPAIVG